VQQADGSLVRKARYDTSGGYSDQMALDAADLNGDGRADLALATAAGVDVFLGTSGGLGPAQVVPTGHAGQVEVADLNGDGRLDLVVNGAILVTGRGDGTFDPPVVVGSGWSEIEVADVTGDGRLDLVGESATTVVVRAQLPDGSFAEAVQYQGTAGTGGNGIAVGDLTGDGRNDVALSIGGNEPASVVNVFPQTAQGTLGRPVLYDSHESPQPLEIGDVNLDGRADLVVVHGGGLTWGNIGHYVQGSDGILRAEWLERVPYATHYDDKALDLGDVDGDRVSDIVYADYNNGLVVLRSGASARAWGLGDRGQVGDGTRAARTTPIAPPGIWEVKDASAGGYHSLAVLADGTVTSWGLNHVGQLGDSYYGDQLKPTGVNVLGAVERVSAGLLHNLARKRDGTAWAWGWNHYGQLGTGSPAEDSAVPVQVSGLSQVKGVAAGGLHSLALRNDGRVWAWGVDNVGQLGVGPGGDSRVPVPVPGLTGVVEVSAGAFHNLALRSDGTVWTWGWNYFGQLGVGSTADSQVPVQVPGLSGVVAVAAGYHHSLALRADGTVWAWGLGHVGQLGNGSTAGSTVPVRVQGLSGVRAIGGGGFHSLASTGGSGWAWGWNYFGQLGNGSTMDRSLPVQVQGIGSIERLSGGVGHTVAAASAGRPLA
jgi:alpha-tubulin suppressor-like RCC1 family protein